MAEKKQGNIASQVEALVKDAVEECGCTLWDVAFVKEGSEYDLILYIDKPEGVSLTDCEMVNDAVESIIDKADPIEESYYLEISSPGLERELKKPAHFAAFIGAKVKVKLYKAQDGKKTFVGELAAYDGETGELTVALDGGNVTFEKGAWSSVKTVFDF